MENSRRLSRRTIVLAALVALLALAALGVFATGCAHRPVNAAATSYDARSGYRFRNTPPLPDNSDEIFVVLAFSGGGTRASAFSFGVMEKLAGITFSWQGQPRRLLDEVDIISSVSGGSFTAAYYGLFRERLFSDFPERFLYKNITAGLAWSVGNPLQWPRLASPHFSRIDAAAELYDKEVFEGRTFADLAQRGARPFIVLNATDMTYVSRFEFTQDQFDLLGSDLSSYPVARGVAASSAFPVLLTPLTLTTYPHDATYREPRWIADALSDRQAAPREFSTARVSRSYMDRANRPFVHLMDGGLADNIGLRGPAYALTSTQGLWSLRFLLNTKIKYLVVIAVNAKPGGVAAWDRRESTPGVFKVLSTVMNGPMGNYSDETIQYVRDTLEAWRQDGVNSREIARLRGDPIPPLREVGFYATELTFQDVRDEAERDYLNGLPTSFNLPREAVDRLRTAAAQLLQDSPEIQRLLTDLAHESKAP